MAEKHKYDKQGRLEDDVSTYRITSQDRDAYLAAERALQTLQVPKILNSNDGNSRAFIANFDGTGNDVGGDLSHATNVGIFSLQMEKNFPSKNIAASYVPGPATQAGAINRLFDGARGYTYDQKLEEMYEALCKRVQIWKEANPDVAIAVIITGFSRGAEEAAGFARLLHERGIQDLSGRHIEHHVIGPDTVSYTKPPLVAPGQVIQSVALFDPVGTGHPHTHDRTLPPSVVSGFQITARDERRNAFPSSQIIPPGLSADGRFLNVTVPGSHSDIGGSYHVDGLAILNGNLMTDFINAHSDVPLLERRPEPEDPSRYVIHRSEEHLFIYRTSTFDRDGVRDVVGSQLSPPHCRFVEICAPPEPLDPALLDRIGERHPVAVHTPVIPEMPDVVDKAPSVAQEPMTSALTADQVRAILHEKEHSNRIDFSAFDRQRHAEVGNIPLSSSPEVDSTPESSLRPVSRPAVPDRGHDLQLLRDVETINEQTRRELGRPGREPSHEHALDQYQGIERDAVAPERGKIELLPLTSPLPSRESAPEQEAAAMAAPPSAQDPRHPEHRDHDMFNAIAIHMGEIHAQAGIDLNKQQMENLCGAVLVKAKHYGLNHVTDAEFGADADGQRNSSVHVFEAFRGDVDDPRTGWAGLDASKAIDIPIETSVERLGAVNQEIDQNRQQQLERQQAQQMQSPGMGMEMGL